MNNLKPVVSAMVDAVGGVLREQWPEVKDYAEEEVEKIAKRVELIVKKSIAGDISKEEAKMLLQMQTNASAGTLAILEGISRLMAEQAINDALKVLKNAIKEVLPFDLFD